MSLKTIWAQIRILTQTCTSTHFNYKSTLCPICTCAPVPGFLVDGPLFSSSMARPLIIIPLFCATFQSTSADVANSTNANLTTTNRESSLLWFTCILITAEDLHFLLVEYDFIESLVWRGVWCKLHWLLLRYYSSKCSLLTRVSCRQYPAAYGCHGHEGSIPAVVSRWH